MFGKKKGFSASQSKRMSKRMQSSTLGTHVSSPNGSARGGGKHARGVQGASQVEFSDGRRASEANRGYVSQVGFDTQSGEDASAYSRRMSRLGYVQEIQRKSRRRRAGFVAAIALLVFAVALGVGVFAYLNSSDSKLSLGSSNADEALVAAEDGEAYYVLCKADLGSASTDLGAQTQAYLLVRVDAAACVFTFVSIPSNIEVTLSDGQVHPLYDACDIGGDAELIQQVADLAGVSIAHFVWTDDEGIAGMTDYLGGITVTVPEEVDDPYAGIAPLNAGEQTLDGQAALTLLRATNFQDGVEVAAENRAAFTLALVKQAFSPSGLGLATLVGDAGSYLKCDLSTSALLAMGDTLGDLDEATVYSCLVPGYETTDEDTGDTTYVVYDDDWESMLALVAEGQDPNTLDSSVANVVPSEVTVEIRNGTSTSGLAATMQELLADAGYDVTEIGNTDDGTTYTETLVIYKEDGNEGAAKALVKELGAGRVVNGGDFYTLSTDVLVIVGEDWMPVS